MARWNKLILWRALLNKFILLPIIVILGIWLSACSQREVNAPVLDAWQTGNKHGTHRVRKGETLYSIAWGYGLDYRELASINHIEPPYTIEANQELSLCCKEDVKYAQKNSEEHKQAKNTKNQKKSQVLRTKPGVKLSKTRTQEKNSIITRWYWPTHGKLIQGFSLKDGESKGIDIAGREGQDVFATQGGEVVYSGSGLRGYGQLIIIKHNQSYLSAYAHNKRNLVKEGAQVTAGQKVAQMGHTEANRTHLHFEIRKNGKPVDPLKHLNSG